MAKRKLWKKSEPKYGISPYAKGTTLNKMANDIAERMRGRRISFEDASKEAMTKEFIKEHNQGEFRRYPLKGEGSLLSLVRLAVGKKLEAAIR